MKTRLLDSPLKRVPIAVAVLTGLILLVAAFYTFLGASAPSSVNGPKIIAAARAYTRLLREQHGPVPRAVSLQTLINQGLLQPADVGSFQGMDAKIFLTAGNDGPTVLMSVHLPDGTDLVLLGDGSTQLIKR